MNIEKLARYLKEFALDEIEMIAECDCKNELEQLLNTNKIVFEQGVFKIAETNCTQTFEVIQKPKLKNKRKILFKDIANYYISSRKLTKSTLKGYKTILKYNLLPYFGEMYLDKITYEMILDFMQKMKEKYRSKTASNAVTLLGSILKKAFMAGFLKHNPYISGINSRCK